jgi:hypothetical protein
MVNAVRALLPYLAFAVVAIGALNFIWFFSETAPTGLIPSNARMIDGQYVLRSKSAGGYVEVEHSFWECVQLHSVTVFASWLFVMLSAWYLARRQPFGDARSVGVPWPISSVAGHILGIAVAGALIWAGVAWVIPQFGAVGMIWVGVLILILGLNLWRFVTAGNRPR